MSSARAIMQEDISEAIFMIEQAGFKVQTGKTVGSRDNQFAGNDELRAQELTQLLQDPRVEAILMARGGYGTMRTMETAGMTVMKDYPKIIAGYSDVTVLHAWMNTRLNQSTLHSTMPVSFTTHSAESVQTLLASLQGMFPSYQTPDHALNRHGFSSGKITGGNLSILYSMLGTRWDWDPAGWILFLEDVDEYLYHVDRMMVALKSAGKLDALKGVIIGGMTDMHDNEIPFGKTAEEIISEYLPYNGIPVCFGFPAGHQTDNMALPFGVEATLEVGSSGGRLTYSASPIPPRRL